MQKTGNLLMVPGPTNVPNRIMAAMQRPMINHRGPEFRQLYRSLYDGMQYAFQTKNHVFALTSSGTGGVECAVSNTISQGDKVVIPVNGGFSQRLKEKIETYGGIPIEIPVELGKAATPNQIREAVEREKNVRAIAIVYNETSTGVTMRGLDEVGRIAEKHNALLLVDAVSVLCGDNLPVDAWKVDLCVTGTQKCLACPPGLALVSVSEKAWQVIHAVKRTSYYFSLPKCKEFHEKEETPFTPALPIYYALDEALKMLKEEGLENRINRHKKCAEAFYNAFRKMGLQLFADPRYLSNTVLVVKIPQGIADKDWREKMREKYGVIVAGGMGNTKGTVIRIGSMGIVSEAEVNTTIRAIGMSLIDLGHQVDLEAGLEAAKNTFASHL